MAANPKAVADYRGGKAAAANALKGAVMRQAKGAVRADVVERVLREELSTTALSTVPVATKRFGELDA
jgi:aspartyl-tRNA(Asn)/glutamyl-tRNA(Gln) amidotransferase subunit B